MKAYHEPDWQELYNDEFQGPQRERHEPIADAATGMVYPNQHDVELFMTGDDELTPLGRHLTETGEGSPAMTPDGMRFVLHDRSKTRGYWEDRARVFAMGQNGQERQGRQETEARPASGRPEGNTDTESQCPQCAGSGLMNEETLCTACEGYGMLMLDRA